MIPFETIAEGQSGLEVANLITSNLRLMETYTNNMGTVKLDFQLAANGPYDTTVGRLNINSQANGTQLRFELTQTGVMFLRNRATDAGSGYVNIAPFQDVLTYGDILVLSKSATEYIPVSPEEPAVIMTYIFKINALSIDQSAVPIILCMWYYGGLTSSFMLVHNAYRDGREYGDEIWMYTEDAQVVSVSGGAAGSVDINIVDGGTGIPCIFNKSVFAFGRIQGGVINVGNAYFAVLSSSETEYERPQIGAPSADPLYISGVYALDLNFHDNPIVLGLAINGRFVTQYDIFKPLGVNDRFARIRNKKGNFQGDSITEQGFYTNWIAANAGVIVQNKGVSGTGYVQDQGTGSTMYTRAALIAADAPDFIVDFAGTNDWAGIAFAAAPLGSMATLADITTFYGAVYQTIKRTREQNRTVPYLICTPIQRNYNNTEPRGYTNSLGLTFEVYVKAIKDIAPIFSAAVLDLYGEAGITVENITDMTSDGVHINTVGGALVGNAIATKVNAMMYQ